MPKGVIFLIALVFSSFSVFSQNYITKDNNTGYWDNTNTWTTVYPGTSITADNIQIYGNVRSLTDLTINKGLLEIHDTLIVEGNLTIDNNANLTIYNGILIVRGNFKAKNKVDIAAGGYLIVMGEFSIDGGGSGSFTSSIDPAKVFIFDPTPRFPPNLTNYTVLQCPAVGYDYTGTTCNYGNGIDITSDSINLLIQSLDCDNQVLYSAGSGNFTDANRWSTISGGVGNYTYSAADPIKHVFVIENGHSVTVTTPVEVGNLVIGKSGGASSLIVNATVNLYCTGDSIQINTNGNLQLNGNYLLAPGTSNRFAMRGGNLLLNSNQPGFLSAFEDIVLTGGTINYMHSGDQSINNLPYNNLTLSGSGNKTLSSSISIKSDIVISTGSTLEITNDNANILISGNWSNQGVFNTNNHISYVEFTNTLNDQSITGYTEFYGLRVNKTAGLAVNLTDSVRVNSNLLFSGDGVLSLGTSNLILASNITQVNSSSGSFNANRMIRLDGTATSGKFIKELQTASSYVFNFPIGSGTLYTPATIGPLSATVTGTARIAINSVPYSSALTNIITRYGTITTSGISNITQGQLRFYYDATEEVGTPNTIVRIVGVVNNIITDADADLNNNYFGAGASNTNLDGEWHFISSAALPVTYYSYQDGDWQTSATWTTDPTGTTQIGMPVAGPTSIDNVVILNGRIVTINNNNQIVRSVTINQGGTLDIQSTNSHTFTNIYGQGTMKLSSVNLPSGNYSTFVASGGGIIEYYNFTGTLSTSFLTYNNLVFSGTGTKTIGGNSALTYILNGNFNLSGGNVIIGAAANTTLNISGNFVVATGCNLSIPTANLTHQIYLKGDFTNSGTIRFTNQASPNYTTAPTTGMLWITFNSATRNQTVICNGQTDFYRFIVDKGFDQSYSVSVSANNTTNFKLFGTNDDADSGPGDTNTPTRTVNKALSIQNGTLILGNNISIPCLTTGNNYRINQSAALIIDGATVIASSSGGSCGSQAIVIYGNEQVNSGLLENACSAGVIIRATGTFILNGGVVNASQLRPSVTSGEHRGAIIINGGVFNLKPVNTLGETKNECARFSIPYASMIYQMTGGTVNIYYPINNGTFGGGLEIGVASDNINVTGGTFNFYIEGNNNFDFTSTAPFFNLNIYRRGTGTGISRIRSMDYNISGTNLNIPANPLVVLNNFALDNSDQTPTFNSGNQDVFIYGNFTASGSSAYIPGSNTTYFNGSGISQVIQSGNSINFNNLVINNTNSSGVVSLGGTGTIAVSGNLFLLSGTFNDGGKTLTIAGNIINSATHSGTGRIRMNNAIATTSTIGGSGNGVWGNLEIDDTNGALMTARQTINGTLSLTNGILDIGSNRLAFSSTGTISIASPSSTRMIRTSGLNSDDGISKTLSTTTNSFTFPFGSGTNYTPATIAVSASTFGTVDIRPVNIQHPLLTIPPATTNDALNYYWAVNSQGFSGISSVNNQFTYTPALIPGGDGNDNSFVSGMYNKTTTIWNTYNGVNAPSNNFSYISSASLDGEYTAGLPAAFGPVTVFESITNGEWETPSTWRRLQGGTVIESPSTIIPGALNPVIIRDGNTVTVNGTTGAVYSGSLEIQNNAIIDLGTTISTYNHNFGAITGNPVTGNGTIRISSSTATGRFPAGDFGYFLGINGGTVVYYRSGTDFTIPTASIAPTNLSLSNYNNLQIIPDDGIIAMPVQDIRIYGNLSTNASAANSYINLSNGANGNLIVDGNISVQGTSTLQYINTTARTITVTGDISISNNASFIVANSGTIVANSITAGGNITNNGTFRFENNGRYVNTTFTGVTNASFTGTGTTSIFNRLLLNKGTDTTYYLTVNAADFRLNATTLGASKAIELINGTFKLESNQTITLSSGANNGANFSIPSTAQLWIDNGTANITATGTNAGLFLGGKLKIANTGFMNLTGGGTNDNYIEYSGVGAPTIEVAGSGQLTVGSQIRRLLTSTNGSLRYIQKGGNVTIGTQSAPSGTRGILEILNSGSEFDMESGTLTIARQQTGASIAALYLNPSSNTVTGGTIKLGYNGITSSNIQLNSSVPMWNLEIGSVPATSITASINVNDLSVLRNLTINSSATLNTNNLNVSIGGDFTSNGTYSYGTNTTTFNGNSNQAINGGSSLSFNDLAIDNSGATVTLNSNIIVDGLLSLNSGVLFDNNHTITANGDIYNAAEHSSSGTGRLIMKKTGIQQIAGSGSGIFGSIEINNISGVYLTTNQTINNTLTFTKGILNIDNHKLTLGSGFSAVGLLNDTSLIKTSGSQSDAGVQINIVPGNFNYLIPIGVSGKYTPVLYSSNSNSNTGYIIVKPVNSQHPLTSDPLNKEMNYYWQVTSNGLAGTTINHQYNYKDIDVIGRGIESDYVGARFYSGAWTTTGSVNSSANQISFPNVNYIDGDYTTGEMSEFTTVVSVFSTLSSGNWEDASTWVGGIVPTPNANVVINPTHSVTINSASKRTYSLYLRDNSELIVGSTTNHNFGIVHGSGTLTIGSNIFPGGDYSGITAADSGTIKYTHSGNISNVLTSYNNLIIASSGSLALPFISPITIRGNVDIQSGTLSASGQRIILYHDFISNGSFIPGNSTLELRGTTAQTINSSSTLNLWNLVVNNAAGINANNSVEIGNNLLFTNGIITPSGTNEIIFAATATHSGVSDQSYINGIVRKISTGSGFTFPVGNGQYRPATLGSFNGEYTVQYYNAGFNSEIVTSPVTRASDFENWLINRVSGVSTPDVTLRWTNANQIPVINNIANLRTAYWNGSAWEEASSSPVITGNLNSGTITVNSFANSGRITFGSIDSPVTRCPGTSNVLYQADNVSTADSYTWTTNNASLVTLTPDTDPRRVFATFTSVNEGSAYILLTVRRGTTVLAIKAFLFQVYPAQPVITASGSTDLCSGGSVQLSVPAGFNAYDWSSGQATSAITVNNAGNYNVRVQHSNGCWSSYSNSVTVNVTPTPTITTINSANSLIIR